MRQLSRSCLPALAALVVTAGAPSTHAATIPSPEGVFTACMSTKSGALRLVERAAQCKGGEQVMTWNQQGQQGPQGEPGPVGSPGVSSFGDGNQSDTTIQPGHTQDIVDVQFSGDAPYLHATLQAAVVATPSGPSGRLSCRFVNSDPDYDAVNFLSGNFETALNGTGTLAFVDHGNLSSQPGFYSVAVRCTNIGSVDVTIDYNFLTGQLAPQQ